ncbi:excinuclease ABC subunit B, partial [Candidatus Gottesmanbacteria bacterium RBG_16_52_11]
MDFKLKSDFKPTGDQPEAIAGLVRGYREGIREQVLVGVTGSGKTFTMANVIAGLNLPTLIISHNKTLAAQLYQEFREFFPQNAVSYFVSYYDYYQPEAYIPRTDTYIEKETEINEEIDKLRLAATANLLTRRDTIIIASVSCIYNIGSPREYGHFVLELKPGVKTGRQAILERLVQLQYERSDFGFHRGTFRVRGDTVDVFPAYEDTSLRIVATDDRIGLLQKIDPMTGKVLEPLDFITLYPAKHYMTDPKRHADVFRLIRGDLEAQVSAFKARGKLLEAHRLNQRVNFDLEMISEMGYVNGIENYSRYFDGRKPGDPPYTLFDYFTESVGAGRDRWLLIIDESHMTVPQIRGMYNGDRSRKQTLVDYGFRLPAALDNRPLRFDEFLRGIPQTFYVSATPDEWEINRAADSAAGTRGPFRHGTGVVEQLVRPTGLTDPAVSVRPVGSQVADLTAEIEKRSARGERVLVTTLTKRMAEDLAAFLTERSIKVHYLHSDIETLKRTDILTDLRLGTFDVIVGVNLLREGLDLPEVSLVAILDADKEGFLRSRISLIQTMGRAARHVRGEVILYADTVTKS